MLERRASRDLGADVAEPDDERQQRDVERAEDRRHPRLEPVVRIGLGERGDRDQDDRRSRRAGAPLPSRTSGKAASRTIVTRERRAERHERRVAGAAEEPEDLDRGDGRDHRDGQGKDRPADRR